MVRSFIVVLSLTAWFALSNHCAFGLAAELAQTESEEGACPMHAKPAKKKPAAKTPCCKEVRAVVAKCVTASPVEIRFLGSRDYASPVFAPPPALAHEVPGLDTGPPGCFSFAESVLQESMLSHAPPVS